VMTNLVEKIVKDGYESDAMFCRTIEVLEDDMPGTRELLDSEGIVVDEPEQGVEEESSNEEDDDEDMSNDGNGMWTATQVKANPRSGEYAWASQMAMEKNLCDAEGEDGEVEGKGWVEEDGFCLNCGREMQVPSGADAMELD
jgi:hypothetical protein